MDNRKRMLKVRIIKSKKEITNPARSAKFAIPDKTFDQILKSNGGK